MAAAETAAVTVALQSARDAHRGELDRLQREKVGMGRGAGFLGCNADIWGMMVIFFSVQGCSADLWGAMAIFRARC